MNTSKSKDKFSPENLFYDGACDVVHAEAKHLKEWRGRKPVVGLALSGGGVRAATFCLGALQALAYRRALPHVDYLSTVSGGGYIGVSLSYLLHQSTRSVQAAGGADAPQFDVSRENFPYVSYPMVGVGTKVSAHEGGTARGLPSERLRQQESFKGRLLRRLRQSANYLAPGDGITLLSLAGVVVRNLANSLLMHVALLVALFQVLFFTGLFADVSGARSNPPLRAVLFAMSAPYPLLRLSGWIILTYGLLSALYIFGTRAFDCLEQQGLRWPYGVRRLYEKAAHYLFVLALVCLVAGGLPWLYERLLELQLTHIQAWLNAIYKSDTSNPVATGLVATLIGVIGNVWALLQSRNGKKPRIPTGLLVAVASALLALGLLMLVYVLTVYLRTTQFPGGDLGIFAAACGVLLMFGWLPEANYVSLHRFYRDRLMELFLPDLRVVRDNMMDSATQQPQRTLFKHGVKRNVRAAGALTGGPQPGDATLLGDLCRTSDYSDTGDKLLRGPYPIINANVVLTASKHPRYRPRGGDNFIFSPLYCGSRATGWNPTERTSGSGFTLATAMAISGAAVNPNAGTGGEGVTRQPVLSVLMGMLNLRLGYWATNRNHASALKGNIPGIPWFKPNQLFPGLAESFGRFLLNEHARFSLLTDGGHFENLGLYELVRRRLKLIIVCDATADPHFKFTDLANAIQKVRADFGAIIDIDAEQLAALTPQPKDASGGGESATATAARGYLIVPIRYSLRVGQTHHSTGEVGTLILLKATVFKGSPAELFSYRSAHPGFPDQSTIDQFFDEKQFDSYRELGYITAYQMLKEVESSGPELGEEYRTSKGYMAPTNYQVSRLLFGVKECATQPEFPRKAHP